MKKFILSSFLVLSVLFNFIPASAQTNPQANKTTAATAAAKRQGIEVPFVNKVLPNGFEVIVLPDKSVPLVTVEMPFRNGSFTEPPELNGFSHLYEHMFFQTASGRVLYRCEIAQKYGNSQYLIKAAARNGKIPLTIGNVAYSRRRRPTRYKKRQHARGSR